MRKFSKATLQEFRHEVDGLVKSAAEGVLRTLTNWLEMKVDGGETNLVPTAIVASTRGGEPYKETMFVLAVPFNSHVEKHAAMIQVADKIFAAGDTPLLIGLASEVWRSKEVNGERRKYLLPEDDPEREEGACIFMLSITKQGRQAFRPFTKGENGRIAWAADGWERHDESHSPLLEKFWLRYTDHLRAKVEARGS